MRAATTATDASRPVPLCARPPMLRVHRRKRADAARCWRDLTESAGAAVSGFADYLASRPDILSAERRHELAAVQINRPACPTVSVEEVVFRQLHRHLSDGFLEFDEIPSHTGFLFQSHHGRLKDGRPAIVTIVRPGFSLEVHQATPALHKLAFALAEDACEAGLLHDAVEDYVHSVEEQTDILRLAEGLRVIRQESDGVHAPFAPAVVG